MTVHGLAGSWNRRFLLYESADGQRSILDASSGHRVDLARLARGLPGLKAAACKGLSRLARGSAEFLFAQELLHPGM
jgi:hypothetical protein